MGDFANRMKALADKFLLPTKFGKTLATFTKQLGDVNPVTLEPENSSADTYEAYCAPVNIKQVQLVMQATGTSADLTVNTNQKFLWVQAGVEEPERGHTVSLDSKNWKILDVQVYEVQDTHCAYLCKIGR